MTSISKTLSTMKPWRNFGFVSPILCQTVCDFPRCDLARIASEISNKTIMILRAVLVYFSPFLCDRKKETFIILMMMLISAFQSNTYMYICKSLNKQCQKNGNSLIATYCLLTRLEMLKMPELTKVVEIVVTYASDSNYVDKPSRFPFGLSAFIMYIVHT